MSMRWISSYIPLLYNVNLGSTGIYTYFSYPKHRFWLFECVVGKCFVVFYVFSFPPAVYVGTLNLIASIPGPSLLTLPYPIEPF